MVPPSPSPPPGRPDEVGRAAEAVEAALATIAGDPVADPGSGPTRRAVTVVEAILAARPAAPRDDLGASER